MKNHKFYLYLDEKGERNIKDKTKQNKFFIGGISLTEPNRIKIVEFMKKIKKEIQPKLEIDKWELKGNSEVIFKNNDKVFKKKYNTYLIR